MDATSDPALRFEAVSALARLLNREFKPTAVSAKLGTERDRLVKRATGNPDPYEKKKWLSNKLALEMLPQTKGFIASAASHESRFRRACLSAVVGNIIEFDIPQHDFKFESILNLILQADNDLAVDEITEFYGLAKRANEILYLTDNAGEIAFDTLLVHELKNAGPRVTVSVKGKPILNDATLQDARTVGMHEVADELITNGTDTVGLILPECSEHFISRYRAVDLVVAKGMGYAETLTEIKLKIPHALLLRTKCQPVANYFRVSKGKNIVKIMK